MSTPPPKLILKGQNEQTLLLNFNILFPPLGCIEGGVFVPLRGTQIFIIALSFADLDFGFFNISAFKAVIGFLVKIFVISS